MRKVIYSINMSIDGCLDHTKMIGNEDILIYFTDLLQDAGLLLYGRVTYQLMVPYWPDVARDQSMSNTPSSAFAKTFDSIDKAVFSTSLERAEGNTRIFRSDLSAEIQKLKREPGKNIYVGGVDLPSQLIAHGLVDEFYFVVHPIIAGEGKHLMEGISLQDRLQLSLADSKPFGSGFVANHYIKQ
jgi:dihydrofolate reductase